MRVGGFVVACPYVFLCCVVVEVAVSLSSSTEMCRGNQEEADKYWKKFEDVEKSMEIEGTGS